MSYADQRYYATGAGRFMTADPYRGSASPVSQPSFSRYSYALGDPINLFDPDGLAVVDVQILPNGQILVLNCTSTEGGAICNYEFRDLSVGEAFVSMQDLILVQYIGEWRRH